MKQDAYGRMGYRSLIAWPERLQREGPFLQRVLEEAPSRWVLDLGCGSGEHCRFLKAIGFRATGVDASESQLQAAREADPDGSYLRGRLTELPLLNLEGHGAALCLGNTLPHLNEEADVQAFLTGLAQSLLPGSVFLLQLLNYDRILDGAERAFPLTVRRTETEGEETVFLRLMTHHGEGRLTFTPATLCFRPGAEPPLELLTAQNVPLRGWRRVEVEAHLNEAGFHVLDVYGNMKAEAWTPDSPDLVVLAQS